MANQDDKYTDLKQDQPLPTKSAKDIYDTFGFNPKMLFHKMNENSIYVAKDGAKLFPIILEEHKKALALNEAIQRALNNTWVNGFDPEQVEPMWQMLNALKTMANYQPRMYIPGGKDEHYTIELSKQSFDTLTSLIKSARINQQ